MGIVDIVSNCEEFRLNKTGNPGMTVGGSGDTLTGIVATLLAQKLNPIDAASIGVFVNSLAGTLAYSELGSHLTPTDILIKY